MQFPLVILAGKAGSGKDTVASLLASKFNGVIIAQADPLKRFAMNLFGFTEEQLWGPSEMRNKVVRLDSKIFEYDWGDLHRNYHGISKGMVASNWLDELGFKYGNSQRAYVYRRLNEWLDLVAHNSVLKKEHDQLKGKRVEDYTKEDFDLLIKGQKNQEYETSPRYVLQTLGTEFGRSIQPTIWADHARKMTHKILAEGGTYERTKGHVPGDQRPSVAIISDGRFRNEILGVKAAGGAAVLIVNPEEKAATFSSHVSEKEQDSVPEWWYDCKIINDKKFGVDKLERTVLEIGNYLGMWRPTTFGYGGR